MSASAPRASWRFYLAALVVAALHVALLDYYGGELLLRSVPVSGLDYETHLSQAWRVIEGLDGWGHAWVYDVQHLAGFPTGTVFDADNKGWTLFAWGLHRLGVPQGRAFNTYVLAAHLLGPLVVYVSARWFCVGRHAALGAAAFASLLWWFDSWLHWCWYAGMTAYAFVSYLWLLPLALFYRYTRERRAWQIVTFAIVLGVMHIMHPYTFFLLVVPLAALYIRAFPTMTRPEHALVWGSAVFTIVVNLWWLTVALRFFHYILDSSLFGDAPARTLPFDILGLLSAPGVTGVIATRATYRFIAIVAGAAMVVRWARRGDPRALPIGSVMLALFLVAYLGGFTPIANIQPYRHVGALAFVALIPAAALVEDAIVHHRVRVWPRAAKRTLLALAVPTVVLCARDSLYFTGTSLPEAEPLPHDEKSAMHALGSIPPPTYEHADWTRRDLIAWVQEHDDGQGRFLVEGWTWGEQLTWTTKAQILGGFLWRNLEHGWANLFRMHPDGVVPAEELTKYLQGWGVRWVIVSTLPAFQPWWDRYPQVERIAVLPPFRIYRVTLPTSLFMKNNGRVNASTNRIHVSGTDPNEDVILRYHWLDTLGCTPDCRVEREEVDLTTVGFIRVPAPHPAEFEIRNTYVVQ